MTPPVPQQPPNTHEPHSGLPLAVLRPIAPDTNLSECGRCGAVVPTFAAWGTNTHSQWHDTIENTPPTPIDQPTNATAWGQLVTQLTTAREAFERVTPTGALKDQLESQAARIYLLEQDNTRLRQQYAGLSQGETDRLRRLEAALIELGAPNHSTRDNPGGPMIVWATDTVVERDNLRRQLDAMRRERDHLGQQLTDLRDTAVTLPDDWRDQLATVLNDADRTGSDALLGLDQLIHSWEPTEVQATSKPDQNLEQPAEPLTLDQLSDLLTLVDVAVPASHLAEWTPAMRKYAESWAALLHVQASDNNVTAPTRPPWLDGGCRSTWRDGDVVCVVEGEHLLHRSSADETSHHFVWSSNVDDAAVAEMTPDQQRLSRSLDKLTGAPPRDPGR